jgi:hypothetical protein
MVADNVAYYIIFMSLLEIFVDALARNARNDLRQIEAIWAGFG